MRTPIAAGGVLELPSGIQVIGRPLRRHLGPADLTIVLGRGPAPTGEHRRLAWPDFGLPLDRRAAVEAIIEGYRAASSGRRVEVACRGGVGRTGTVLAALAVLDGLSADEAVTWVRQRYHPRAVETPWQRRWLRHLEPRSCRPWGRPRVTKAYRMRYPSA